jgi:hypothetical protein
MTNKLIETVKLFSRTVWLVTKMVGDSPTVAQLTDNQMAAVQLVRAEVGQGLPSPSMQLSGHLMQMGVPQQTLVEMTQLYPEWGRAMTTSPSPATVTPGSSSRLYAPAQVPQTLPGIQQQIGNPGALDQGSGATGLGMAQYQQAPTSRIPSLATQANPSLMAPPPPPLQTGYSTALGYAAPGTQVANAPSVQSRQIMADPAQINEMNQQIAYQSTAIGNMGRQMAAMRSAQQMTPSMMEAAQLYNNNMGIHMSQHGDQLRAAELQIAAQGLGMENLAREGGRQLAMQAQAQSSVGELLANMDRRLATGEGAVSSLLNSQMQARGAKRSASQGVVSVGSSHYAPSSYVRNVVEALDAPSGQVVLRPPQTMFNQGGALLNRGGLPGWPATLVATHHLTLTEHRRH